MKNSNEVNYFYKACDLSPCDEVTRKRYEYFNDYGYNFSSSSKRVIDTDKVYANTKRMVNSTKR